MSKVQKILALGGLCAIIIAGGATAVTHAANTSNSDIWAVVTQINDSVLTVRSDYWYIGSISYARNPVYYNVNTTNSSFQKKFLPIIFTDIKVGDTLGIKGSIYLGDVNATDIIDRGPRK